jgi:hypothetical protein
MSPNRYCFEVIDSNGCCELAAEMLASDMTAVFDKITEISEGIDRPGYLIRVKDQHGNAVFVGMTTQQGAEEQGNHAA